MLLIEYTSEYCYGEEGPNLVWLCDLTSAKMIYDIFSKLSNYNQRIVLESNEKIKLTNCKYIYLVSSENGKHLVKVDLKNSTITTELPKKSWDNILSMIEPLLNQPGFNYIEFDNCAAFTEDANWIIERKNKVRKKISNN